LPLLPRHHRAARRAVRGGGGRGVDPRVVRAGGGPMSRRAILLTLLALLAPLPAVAVGGGGPQSLSVSAALGGCGLIDNSVACRVDVSWSALAKADSYSVSVTAPGGSVVGSAETSGASTSLWIP